MTFKGIENILFWVEDKRKRGLRFENKEEAMRNEFNSPIYVKLNNSFVIFKFQVLSSSV